jgi:hypothetical protein
LKAWCGESNTKQGAQAPSPALRAQAEFEEVVGRGNMCTNVQEALQRAETVFEMIGVKPATVT